MRRTGIATLTLLVAFGMAVPAAAAPVPYDNLVRIEGGTPRAAAIAISTGLYPQGGLDAAVLARQDTFPDALGASALTTDVGGPLLLTDGQALSSDTEEELQRVLREGATVYLLGGEAALGDAVAERLAELGFRTPRFPGRDRIETAAQVARFAGTGPSDTVVLVRAFGQPDLQQGWVDSVSCGGWAAATGTPILLTRSSQATVSADTLSAMADLGVRNVEVCGGAAAVPASQLEQLRDLGIQVTRHAGPDRVATALAVATGLWDVPSRDGRVFLLVPGFGTDFGYGLVAAPLSARLGAPILLVGTDEPTACADQRAALTLCFLGAGDEGAAGVLVVAPPEVISDEVMLAAGDAAGLPRDVQAPAVPSGVEVEDRPEDDGTALRVSWTASEDASGSVTYQVRATPAQGDAVEVDTAETSVVLDGLDPDTEYTVTIVAIDVFENASAPSAPVTETPTDEVPEKPAAAPNVQVDGNDVTVSWFAAPEADVAAYVVQRFTHGLLDSDCEAGFLSSTQWQTIATVDAPVTSYVDEGVSDEVCYRYAIEDTTGNRTAFSGAFGPVDLS